VPLFLCHKVRIKDPVLVIQINGVADHIHKLLGLKPTQALSELIQVVKAEPSLRINEKGFMKHRSSWQQGFGAFSYSKAQWPKVISYIENQEEHHKQTTFRSEYLQLLYDFEVSFDERYIFKEVS